MQHTSLNPTKTFAILMGTSRYDHFPDIPPVTKNLDDLQDLLLDPAIFGLPKNQVHRIQDQSSDKAVKQLRHYASEASKAKAQTLLFYFCPISLRTHD